MKKFIIGSGVFIFLILIILLLSTSMVKRSSYFDEDYFKVTAARVDSLAKTTAIKCDIIEAGFSRVSITPSLNEEDDNFAEGKFRMVSLAGFGDRKGKPATGVHDSIFVKVAAIRTGGRTAIIIGADLLIMPPNVTDSVVMQLSASGIQREQLFFSATHTHSSLGGWAPGFIGKEFAGDENVNIRKWLVKQISEAVLLALDDMKPARIGTGSFPAENFTRNRTIGESGTKNNDFCYICLEQKGARKAVIGSFSAHSTTLGDENMEVSADYPGYWASGVEGNSADLAIFLAGATGSQSPVSRGDAFDEPAYIGHFLADSMNKVLAKTIFSDSVIFSYVSAKIELPEYNIRITPSINLSTFWSRKLMPYPENVYLQAIRLGNMVWVSTPCDFSGEYALQLKNAMAMEKFVTNVTSFNGSYVGYIMPGKYFYVDDYESKTMGWFGPDMGDYTFDMIRKLLRIVTQKTNI